jgi:hypothetical protein
MPQAAPSLVWRTSEKKAKKIPAVRAGILSGKRILAA